jgi:peroxiredoxin
MNRTRILILFLLVAPLVGHAATTDSKRFTRDATKVKPLEVGSAVPAVNIRTASGASFALADELKGHPSVILFYRGGWCPYCNRHLAEMQEIEPELRRLGYRIYAISPDRPEVGMGTVEGNALTYTLLSDPSAVAIRAFGLAFQLEDALVSKYKNQYGIDIEADSGETHHLLPVPALFLVDANGVIQFRHYDPDYKSRIDSSKVLTEAESLVDY